MQEMDKIEQVSFLLHKHQRRQYVTNIWFENVEKIKEMVPFEWDLWDLVNKRKFQKVSNFQNQLKASKKLKKLFVFADKTSDIYQTERDEYNKSPTDTITSTYKKIPDKMSNKVYADGNINNRNKKAFNRIFLNGRTTNQNF